MSEVKKDADFQKFLDQNQYARKGILLYERIFGDTYISTGGERTTEHFCKQLEGQALKVSKIPDDQKVLHRNLAKNPSKSQLQFDEIFDKKIQNSTFALKSFPSKTCWSTRYETMTITQNETLGVFYQPLFH